MADSVLPNGQLIMSERKNKFDAHLRRVSVKIWSRAESNGVSNTVNCRLGSMTSQM